MKKIISFLFILTVAFTSNAQNNSPTAPIMKFVEETHDFGNIKEGPLATVDFNFTNTGKEPLLIRNCSASCGCTTPNWSKEPILPGQKGKITVTYNTQGRDGSFNKTIYIASNAKSDKERYEIYIKGNVIADAKADNAKAPSPAPASKH